MNESFVSVSLKTLGLRIQLGHPLGQRCPNPVPAFNDDFVVLDTGGIHPVGLDFCDCHLALPRNIQLLRARLFPATTIDPKTAATFSVLELFQLLTFMSKISGFDFYNTLARLTDNTGTVTIPVSLYIVIGCHDTNRHLFRIDMLRSCVWSGNGAI